MSGTIPPGPPPRSRDLPDAAEGFAVLAGAAPEGDKGLRILLVEDDPAHAELVRRGFAGHRIRNEIRHAASGEEALEYLLRLGIHAAPESSPRPDVILLGLRLPGLDGLEVLREVRSSKALDGLPVIILTTSEAESDRLAAYDERIDGYIVKPMNFDSFAVLLDVISLALKHRGPRRKSR